MNIAASGYSEAELLKYLFSRNRTVWYEYTVADVNDKTIGKLDMESGKVSFDSRREIMRTFSASARKSQLLDINVMDERIIPWLCLRLNNGDVIKWALGRFIVQPSQSCEQAVSMINVTGYDLSKIAYDDKVAGRYYVPAGSVYTSTVAQLLGSLYKNLNVEFLAKTKQADQEWEIGTSKLTIANELLSSINYNPFYFDEYGNGIIEEYINPANRPVELAYSTVNNSIFLDSVDIETNRFDIANKFIRYTENVDSRYLISIYENNDVNSPYSIVNRGRTIVDAEMVNDIATQADLDSYTIRAALSKMQSAEVLTFHSLNMPGHGYQNSLYVECGLYGIDNKYVEISWEMELKTNGTMRHVCERVLNV
ncbi:MAG: hypothetical protein NC086_05100 [Alistipes sp.]|nr:hypothetical protein [Alistipes sp.]